MMGLDMYLEAEKYVSNYNFSPPNEKATYAQVVDAVGLGSLADPDSPSATIKVTVAYWRKANAIHGWFVENVQDGEDNCQSYYVEREKLLELRTVAALALSRYNAGDRAQAGELLSPRSGFFFGSTEIDDWFAEDLKRTVAMLDRVLASDGDYDFYYRASW